MVPRPQIPILIDFNLPLLYSGLYQTNYYTIYPFLNMRRIPLIACLVLCSFSINAKRT